jgi:hypothetical protein
MKSQFEAPEARPLPTSLSPITGGTSEVNLWTPALYTPIPAAYADPNMQWVLEAGGVYTAPATPGTLIVTARFGTSATPASNTTGGATIAAVALGVIAAQPFLIRALITCRLVSLAGANSTFICNGAFFGGPNIVVPFGGTVASIDSSAASALAISVTPSVTGQSYTVQQISWRSLN